MTFLSNNMGPRCILWVVGEGPTVNVFETEAEAVLASNRTGEPMSGPFILVLPDATKAHKAYQHKRRPCH